MRRNDTPGGIVTNFCTGVGVHDVITSANFYDCGFWGLSVVEGQILGFSIDSRCRPYNTLALPCECVMKIFLLFYMYHFAMGLTRCYKTTVFLHLYLQFLY